MQLVLLLLGVLWAPWMGVKGHGRLVDPPGRSTMWRLGFDTPVNYNDHQLFCGGYRQQWMKNRGRCGECGDPWDIPRPRPNEAGGIFGTGLISKVYHQGQVITVTVHLTANHMGWFEFRLCPNDNPNQYVKQSCLNKHVLTLIDYPGTRYQIKHSKTGLFRVRLQLPDTVTCSQKVVQWHYTTGNNWGFCKDGSNQPGCGPQEVFRGCSDVAIFALDDPTFYQFNNLTRETDLSRFLHLSEEDERRPAPPALQAEGEEGEEDEDEPLRSSAHQDDVPDVAFDLGLVFDGEEHFAADDDEEDDDDDFSESGHLASGLNDLVKTTGGPGGVSKQPSISFVEESKGGGRGRLSTPKSSALDASAIRRPDYFSEEQGVPLPPKKYVSSDVFRKSRPSIRIDDGRFPSAPTPFFPSPSGPFVISPDVQGVTPSPLGPPLALPSPQRARSSALRQEGLRSVPFDGPSEEYKIVTTFGHGGAGGAAAHVADTQEAVHETLPLLEEITPAVLQLFQNYPGLAQGGVTNTPVAFQVPLSSLQEDSSMDRLLMLQQALSLTSTSGTQSDSPIVLILM
ncbi:uncharacterized protein LOC122245292 [Penaeus japonicus]|uniref:uncharacterized protein LOC122245292 n=1 Tax=Penaeus japonicus TaxID=27405 RepID=UPI001C710A50|nr:uncharacterized protein LOC122245292 [Penaeus japonicus]